MTAPAWFAGPRVGFDLETTGIDVWTDRVVTACIVNVVPASRPLFGSWLVDPQIEIPKAAADVHGITTEHARAHGVHPTQALGEITQELAWTLQAGIPVVGFNLAYDLTLLESENRRHGLPTLTEMLAPGPVAPIVDVMVLDKQVDTYRKGSRKLGDVCRHYTCTLAGAHDSGADALAAVRVASVIAARYPDEVGNVELDVLHAKQIEWRAEQQTQLAKYFRSKGKDVSDIWPEWPIVPPRNEIGGSNSHPQDAASEPPLTEKATQ